MAVEVGAYGKIAIRETGFDWGVKLVGTDEVIRCKSRADAHKKFEKLVEADVRCRVTARRFVREDYEWEDETGGS
jgi:hypothetical protein